MKPTLGEQIRCVERELRMRSRVYPGLVDRRKMSPADCDRELLHMSAVLETLKHCEVLAKCLEEAPRQRIEHVEQGATIEGAAYVSISHELAKQIAAQLRGGS